MHLSFTGNELIMVGFPGSIQGVLGFMGSPGWQNIVFPLSLHSWPLLFVSSPSFPPGRHYRRSQVAYLLVRPELTADWLVALNSSPLILLKWSCSLRHKLHFPQARERCGCERRGKTEELNFLNWEEDRWKIWTKKTEKWMENDKEEWDPFLLEVQVVCVCMEKCSHKCVCVD